VFNNLFQSAPAVAQYVAAALEAGTTWNRVERFFLASFEEDRALAAIKVQVKGRMGERVTGMWVGVDTLPVVSTGNEGVRGVCVVASTYRA
jgi:ribosomal protein S3